MKERLKKERKKDRKKDRKKERRKEGKKERQKRSNEQQAHEPPNQYIKNIPTRHEGSPLNWYEHYPYVFFAI
jgi:hypothetical protein